MLHSVGILSFWESK